MIKKIILAAVIFIAAAYNSYGQFTINILGPASAYEGETVEYKINYTNLPAMPFFTSGAVNGTIVAQNLSPFKFGPPNPLPSGYFIRVRWNCNEVGGSITLTENNSGVTFTLNTVVFSYVNDPDYCKTVVPVKQNLIYNQPPTLLTLLNCSPCASANSDITPYQFQWQVGDVPIGTFPQVPLSWANIPLANSSEYLPPVYTTECIKAYRRVTTFTYQGMPYTRYSEIAVISTFDYLSGGIISGGTSFNNGVPVITQTPATGGLCDGFFYGYTWEFSTDNINWTQPGSGVNYPAGLQIPGACYIRRSVVCNGEIQYSNTLTINPPPLNPGTITGGGTVTFNTFPAVAQTLATGSACNPADYIYTWERSINNGGWLTFGTAGFSYPANAGIIGSCKIRRKVHCVYEDAYSNEIVFTMLPYTSPNAENLNYVRTNDIVIPGVQSWEQADALVPTGDKLQSTTYLDGFGRGIQSVVKQGSLKQTAAGLDPNNINNYQDLVSHIQYDGLGRADKGFLPYATTTSLGFYKTNAAAEQQSFNNQKYGEPANSMYTYSQTTYDGSPLNRVTNVKLPGSAWNSDPNYKGISSDYDFNKQTENVRIWDIGFTPGDVPTTSGVYGDNLLTKSITKDEKDKLIITYADLSGNTILKRVQEAATVSDNSYAGWLNTYYVYDDFGRLRYTITPKAVALMAAPGSSWSIDGDIKKGLCFYQEYDKRGRVNVKHSPDGGEVWLVYDNRDRLVLSQDENQRNRTNMTPAKPNQWSFSLYDENDRILTTGLINDSRNRATMQLFVDGLAPQNQPVQIYTGAYETITAYNPVTINTGAADIFINSVSYYDDYSQRPLSQKPVNLSITDFATTTNQYVEQPVVTYSRIRGAATVSKIRILNANYDSETSTATQFLTSTTYYDEKGRITQSFADNIKGGTDASAVLYDFAGKVLCTKGKHSMPNNSFDGLLVVTKNEYDLLGRATKLWKLYTKNAADIANTSKYKKLSEVKLDELGRGKTKTIGDDPVNPGSSLETLDYSYNIQGWLTGVNKEYALANPSHTDQFKRRFGFYLGYENTDANFADKQYNGSITGVIWRSQGDNMQRKYNYEYDNINRFKAANFTQKDNGIWGTTLVDVSASVSAYDANGNIQGMLQKGIVPGTNGGVVLDNLQYNYYAKSNMLQAISDAAPVATNGKQGDFKNFLGGSTGADYDYDKNGNLKNDKNKNITTANNEGIVSNFLDLPQTITIKDKSKTEYTYDAAGGKLAKKVTQLIPNAPAPVTTWFIGGFVYEENSITGTPQPELKYIVNEEGKLRITEVGISSTPQGVIQASIIGNVDFGVGGVNNKQGVWDYYLKDNLTNTRMVITEEQHVQLMKCTIEGNNPPANPTPLQLEEEAEFGNATNNEVKNTRADKPSPLWTNNPSAKVSKLIASGSSTAIGPNAILKVMAGDMLDLKVDFFYQANGQAQNTPIASTILQSLLGAISNSNSVTSGVKGNIPTNSSTTLDGINSFLHDNQPLPPSTTTTPRAYLNYIFFDEQFRYVGEISRAKQVLDITSGTYVQNTLPATDIKVTKNGYLYIYLSNETNNVNVYFDNLQIKHTRGLVVEDNAYYPFGLKIQGISAKAAGKPKTKQGYQGDYNEQDEETGYNEFALRTYDPQIGRWLQVDPKIDEPGMYNGMGNNPVIYVDPKGSFKKWFGAWLYKKIHGISGTISRVKEGGRAGEWYVSERLDALEGALGDGKQLLQEVVVNRKSYFEWGLSKAVNKAWNSKVVRSIVPDYYQLSFGFSSPIYGPFSTGGEYNLVLVTRGTKPGLYTNKEVGVSISTGGGGPLPNLANAASGNVTFGRGYFLGSTENEDITTDVLGGPEIAIGASANIRGVPFTGELEIGIGKGGKPSTMMMKIGLSSEALTSKAEVHVGISYATDPEKVKFSMPNPSNWGANYTNKKILILWMQNE